MSEGARPRTTTEPTTVFVVGLLGLVLCQICGPFAWWMGNRYLAECAELGIEPEGLGVAGRILGIVGTILLIVMLVLLLLYVMLWVVLIVVYVVIILLYVVIFGLVMAGSAVSGHGP